MYVGSADWMPRNLYERVATDAVLPPAVLEKLQGMPVYEALSAKWVKDPDPDAEPASTTAQPSR